MHHSQLDQAAVRCVAAEVRRLRTPAPAAARAIFLHALSTARAPRACCQQVSSRGPPRGLTMPQWLWRRRQTTTAPMTRPSRQHSLTTAVLALQTRCTCEGQCSHNAAGACSKPGAHSAGADSPRGCSLLPGTTSAAKPTAWRALGRSCCDSGRVLLSRSSGRPLVSSSCMGGMHGRPLVSSSCMGGKGTILLHRRLTLSGRLAQHRRPPLPGTLPQDCSATLKVETSRD
jgi:hypothetical protein